MPVESRCGKVAYATSGEATKAMLDLRRGTGDRRVGVYRCPGCRSWHVGSNRLGDGFEGPQRHLRFDLHKRRGKRRRWKNRTRD
jgi:hypothetical protein